jgi:nucleotide-binding universal stress UspA family protein
MKTILTPIDFSDVTDAVVKEAASLAQALNGRVVLLTVVQPPVVMTEYAALMENIAELTAAGERNASLQLEKIEKQLAAAGIPTETCQTAGSPITHIVREAADRKADYIVMGSHGHTALYELLVGSTTHGVLLRARCPVVIVPAAEEERPAKVRKERATAAT